MTKTDVNTNTQDTNPVAGKLAVMLIDIWELEEEKWLSLVSS